MRNALEGINSRLEDTQQSSNLGDRIVEITQLEQQEEKRIKKNEDSLRYLQDNIKETNIHVVGVPDGEEKKKGREKLFEEIMAENFPNLVTETDIQVQTR